MLGSFITRTSVNVVVVVVVVASFVPLLPSFVCYLISTLFCSARAVPLGRSRFLASSQLYFLSFFRYVFFPNFCFGKISFRLELNWRSSSAGGFIKSTLDQ